MKFGIKIDTQVIVGGKDSSIVLAAQEGGWTVSQEFVRKTRHETLTLTVLTRVLIEGQRPLNYPNDLFPVKLYSED